MTLLPPIAFLIFAYRRLLTYLHIFQQEEYDNRRFLPWLVRTRSVDKRVSMALFACAILTAIGVAVAGWIVAAAQLIASLVFLAAFFVEANPMKAGKKRLVLTSRAKRILAIAILAAAILGAALATLSAYLSGFVIWVWIVAVQALPLCLVVSNLCLAPYERMVQKRFWTEAHRKLGEIAPTVVGITGSYGKTSVKHILGHVLQLHATTLITPGSVNTPMGITRIIRERLDRLTKYFVCEMGAYGPGSIARLCRLAPPKIAIITAVGHAHFERFKTLDSVASAKLELAEAAATLDGSVILSEALLSFSAVQAFYARHKGRTTLVGTGPAADAKILRVTQAAHGLEVEIDWAGARYVLAAPLYGLHHGQNLALAFASAAIMGVPPDHIVLALSSTPQIKHRLEVKSEPDGSTLVDDAYNSNPVGFASALEILDLLRKPAGRRILVTPGMVELGSAHEEEHEKIGAIAGRHVDVLLPVLPERIGALTSAFKLANPAGEVVPCRSFADAQTWMRQNIGSGDVILLENDLPDLYERKLAL